MLDYLDTVPDHWFFLFFIGAISIAHGAKLIFSRWVSGRWTW